MNVFLVGFMGSGKTSLGKQLASKLNRPFLDLDALIVESSGKSISDMFESQGETAFRKLEQEILFGLHAGKNAVVSLGGGAACSEDAWKFMNQNGFSIYLKVRPEVLFGRLKVNRSSRPLIAHLDDNALRDFIEKKMEERRSWYERADMVFEKEKDNMWFLLKQITGILD